MTLFPLGRHPQAAENHDPRSLNYPAATGLPVVSKVWRRYGAVLDQGQVGSCTGNASIHARNSAPNHVAYTPVYHEPDAVKVYTLATQLDPYPGSYPTEDTGSDGVSASNAMRQLGLITSFTHSFGVDHMVETLMYGPVIMGSDWYEQMFYPDANGLVTPGGTVAGGHEYAVTGYDATHRIFRFQNSWSNTWGVRGRFYMTWDATASLLGAGGDAIQFQV